MNLHYLMNELYYQRRRTLAAIVGLSIGIALFVSINAVSSAYQKAVSLPFKNLGADIVVQKPEKRAVDAAQTPTSMRGIRLPFSNQLFSQEELRKLGSLDGVASSASSLLLWEFDQGGFRTIMGVDLSRPSLGPVKVKEWLSSGRFPNLEGEIVLEKHYAKFHHAGLGGTFTIGGRPFTVVGLLEIKEGAQIAASNIYLSLLASIIALGGAIFLIIKTMLANLVARSSEIGILKAVGWTEKDVQKQLMGEALLQSFLGGLAGLVIGYAISYALGFLSIPVSTPWEINLMPAFARDSETTAAVRLPVALSAGLTGAAPGLSLFAGALASFFMGRRTSRMKPVDILRRP